MAQKRLSAIHAELVQSGAIPFGAALIRNVRNIGDRYFPLRVDLPTGLHQVKGLRFPTDRATLETGLPSNIEKEVL